MEEKETVSEEFKESYTKFMHAERATSAYQSFIKHALIFILTVYVMFGWIVGVTTCPNGDMYPRIDSGDLLLYYRLDKKPQSQDVIVFIKNDTRYVGRVIAAAGDTVEITEKGAVLVNGNSRVESNIFFETYPLEGFTDYPLKLKEDECFVLMDRRRGSEDSRFFGPVNYREIKGTVITVVRRNNL